MYDNKSTRRLELIGEQEYMKCLNSKTSWIDILIMLVTIEEESIHIQFLEILKISELMH